MYNLFQRLFISSTAYEKIAVHAFYSALVDFAAGYTTKAQIITVFILDATAEANLDSLIAAYQVSTDKNQWLQELHAVMCLAEAELKYNSGPAFAARMGL